MNIANIPKDKIVEMGLFKCKHKHTGLSHPKCFYRNNVSEEKIGFVDIEASNLVANFGIILSYCIKEENGPITQRVITPEALKSGTFDRDLMKQFCIDARKFTRLVGWYSNRFDIPYIRTRCVYHKLDFPVYKEIAHTDAWRISRDKLKLHSNRLEVVSKFLGISAKGHPLNPEIWLRCLSGNKKALKFVLTHNIEDVVSLEAVWHRIKDYARLTKTSM